LKAALSVALILHHYPAFLLYKHDVIKTLSNTETSLKGASLMPNNTFGTCVAFYIRGFNDQVTTDND
jgi:hypothetical protein